MSEEATNSNEEAQVRVKALSRQHFITIGHLRGTISIICLFILWHIGSTSDLSGVKEIPTPMDVAETFWKGYLLSLKYWSNWSASFERVFYGFILAQIIGIPTGILFGLNDRIRSIVFPVFEIMRPVPPLAWVPLSILFWPTNESSIVFITFLGAFFVIVINIYEAIRHIPNQYMWLATSLGAQQRHLFFRIVLPAVIPSIAAGMTLGIALTWEVVIAAEMIASDRGLGRLTWEGYVSSTPAVTVIGMISIGLAGYLSTLIVSSVEKKMMPWAKDK